MQTYTGYATNADFPFLELFQNEYTPEECWCKFEVTYRCVDRTPEVHFFYGRGWGDAEKHIEVYLSNYFTRDRGQTVTIRLAHIEAI